MAVPKSPSPRAPGPDRPPPDEAGLLRQADGGEAVNTAAARQPAQRLLEPQRPPAPEVGAAVQHASGARRWRPTVLQIALLFSVALHAGVLTLRIVDPERFERVFRDTPLEVILVNTRGGEAPAKAQAIAQAALAGGGEAQSGRATSPLPAATQVELGESADDARRRIDQLQQQQQQLLATVQQELATLPPPDPQRDAGSPQAQEQQERRRQLLKLLAEIEKRIQEENARPRKRYVSPATKEAVYAIYYDRLRRKVEERGTRDFPVHQGRKLYGELTMNIVVDAAGRVVEADVLQGSGNKVLDGRAVAIVRASQPYGNFTGKMLDQADQIVVTSRFRFTRDEALSTTLSEQPPR